MNRVIQGALGALLLSAAVAQAQEYDPRRAFAEADKNKDNSISMSEFYERSVDVFFLGDKNKDGKLSKDEYDAVVVIREDFSQVDKNGDGVISENEFITARVPLFEKADTNKDGKLSEQEVVSAYEANKK